VATNYTRGRDLEYRTAQHLEAEGYDCTRSAGSHGVWDVCAVRKDHVRFVQVKRDCLPTAIEREKFELWECPPSCTREIWVWRKPLGRWVPSVEVI
jgi:Holliday junction resolvase